MSLVLYQILPGFSKGRFKCCTFTIWSWSKIKVLQMLEAGATVVAATEVGLKVLESHKKLLTLLIKHNLVKKILELLTKNALLYLNCSYI